MVVIMAMVIMLIPEVVVHPIYFVIIFVVELEMVLTTMIIG